MPIAILTLKSSALKAKIDDGKVRNKRATMLASLIDRIIFRFLYRVQ